MEPTRRRRGRRGGFTLVEALVSITIAAAMLLVIAVIFRQASSVTRQTRASAHIHQVARHVFEQLGRDLAGVSVEGFIFLRCQSRNWDGVSPVFLRNIFSNTKQWALSTKLAMAAKRHKGGRA